MRHGEIDSRDLAGYIAAMAGEMTAMAQLGDLRTLAYLTDMVRLEAENQCQSRQRTKPSGPPS